MEAEPKTPGERVRYARRLKRWNQHELARQTYGRITQSSISDIETGQTKEVSGPNLIWLAGALGVRPEWIITGEQPMEPVTSPDELRLVLAYRSTMKVVNGGRDEKQDAVPGQLPSIRENARTRKNK